MISPPKAILYTRVSTEGQDKGTSPEEQLAACRDKVARIGAIEVAHYYDQGVSGARFHSRPGIQSSLADLREGRADTIIIANLSRYSRDREHQSRIKRLVERAGGRLVFCDLDFDLATPEGEFAFNVMGDFAHYERRNFRDRSMKGKTRLAINGRQPQRGQRPFGYSIVCRNDVIRQDYPDSMLGHYIIREEEAERVRCMYAEYAGGSSLNAIARRLWTAGVQTARGSTKWHAKSIRKILTNSLYKGVAAYGKTEMRRHEDEEGYHLTIKFLPEDQWLTFDAPPIVSDALWAQVQDKLARSHEENSGRTDRKYALSGIIRCPSCGRCMRYVWRRDSRYKDSKRNYYWECPRSRRANAMGTPCAHKSVHSARNIEVAVLARIEDLVASPEARQSVLRAHSIDQAGGYDPQEHARLIAQLEKTEADEQRVVGLQVQSAMRGVDASIYVPKLKDLAARKSDLRDQLGHVERLQAIHKAVVTIDEDKAVAEALGVVRRALEHPDLTGPEKHELYRRILDRVIPHKGRVDVYFRYPILTK